MRKNNAGFTLVELIVSIAASTLVIGAALSFMLFGMRMEKAASDDMSVQSDSRIIMRVLENIASEMSVADIKVFGEESEIAWELHVSDKTGEEPVCILSFNRAQKTINGKDGVVIIEGIKDSELSYENRILKCEVLTTSDDRYTSSVYCRVGSGQILLADIEIKNEEDRINEELEEKAKNDQKLAAEMPARKEFLINMVEQYGSTGRIYDNTIFNGYEFATWYWAVNLRTESEVWIKQPEKVAWCAIFVSWALNKTVSENPDGRITQNLDALVDNVMWYQFGRVPDSALAVDEDNNDKFNTAEKWAECERKKKEDYAQLGKWFYPDQEIGEGENKKKFTPHPGDIVFFENDSTNDRADHLGVVIYTDENAIYVMEGNNEDRVGVFAYTNKDGIYTDGVSAVIGYGVIDWESLGLTVEVTEEQET